MSLSERAEHDDQHLCPFKSNSMSRVIGGHDLYVNPQHWKSMGCCLPVLKN